MLTVFDILEHIDQMEQLGGHPIVVWMSTLRFVQTFLESDEMSALHHQINRECPGLKQWLVNGPNEF